MIDKKKIPNCEKNKHIAFFLFDLNGGGIERVNLHLMRELRKRGFTIDLILVKKQGDFLCDVPEGVRIFDLNKNRAVRVLFTLAKILHTQKPKVLFTAIPTINIIGLAANILSGFSTNVIPTEHVPASIDEKQNKNIEPKIAYKLYPLFYRTAKRIVLISEESATMFKKRFPSISNNKFRIIYNPVVSKEIFIKACESFDSPWKNSLSKELPIILGVGRLSREKNFEFLINAFASILSERACVLVILGKGDEKEKLVELSKQLNIEDSVFFPGHVANPYAYMSKASVFVLSSIYETLPTVLIEALACGTKVVATNCGGVKEILENGKYGKIIEKFTTKELKEAICESLDEKIDKEVFVNRAKEFSSDHACQKYINLIEESVK